MQDRGHSQWKVRQADGAAQRSGDRGEGGEKGLCEGTEAEKEGAGWVALYLGFAFW